jgi:hypothetical protein
MGEPLRACVNAPVSRQRMDSATSHEPDLAEIIAAWPQLPEAIKAGILAMIRTSVNGVPR